MTKMGFLRGVINTISTNISTLLTNLATVRTEQTLQQQADAVISQNNPVSNQLYTVLDTTTNVEIISFGCSVNWDTTQPTNLRVIVTVDGITKTFTCASPVTATGYVPSLNNSFAASDQFLVASASPTVASFASYRECSGRSVKVQVAVTWSTTQPTPLICRVKYANR